MDPEIDAAGDVDTAIVFLGFGAETLVVVTNCRKAAYGHAQRIEVLVEKGAVFVERYREADIADTQAFVETVHKKDKPVVTGWDEKVG